MSRLPRVLVAIAAAGLLSRLADALIIPLASRCRTPVARTGFRSTLCCSAREPKTQAAVDELLGAVARREASKEEVSEALETLEKASSRTVIQADDVEGSWELVFSTQLSSGYMPVREVIGFFPSQGTIALDTNVGPLPLGGMRGSCTWKGGGGNALEFALSSVKLGPFALDRGAGEPKTYSFFLAGEKIAAARSSAGGLALLARVDPV